MFDSIIGSNEVNPAVSLIFKLYDKLTADLKCLLFVHMCSGSIDILCLVLSAVEKQLYVRFMLDLKGAIFAV